MEFSGDGSYVNNEHSRLLFSASISAQNIWRKFKQSPLDYGDILYGLQVQRNDFIYILDGKRGNCIVFDTYFNDDDSSLYN